MGNVDHSQPITAALCCSVLLTFFSCSSVSPSHGLQSFRITLLLHGLQRPSGHIHMLQRGVLRGLQHGDLLVWSSPWAAGDSLLQHLEVPLQLLLLFLLPWWSQGCFSQFVCSFFLFGVFCPFLHMLFQRPPQLCPVVGLLVEVAMSGMGQPQLLLTEATPQPLASPWAPAPSTKCQ